VKIDNFFAELKRRNVYKVAVAYVIVGWLVVQVATQVFPFFEIPNWAVRLIVLATVIGFPIALVIAWAFEVTPEGIKRTEDVDTPEEHSHGGAWVYIVIVGMALSLGLFFLGRYTASRANGVRTKSIAVLPFENLSDDKGAAYFADGIQDEILTKLASIADLKVISRTSTAKYKSKPEDLKTVSQQLGVATVLEGSVQKANDQVRVNVQLINATTDAHLWADTYDRKLTDIFAVESDIAKTIADTLQARLTGSEKISIAKTPTVNPEAYELYLKGRFFGTNGRVSIFEKRLSSLITPSREIRTMRWRMPVWPIRICCCRITADRPRQTSSLRHGLRSPKRLRSTIR
jgi:TolB-like protein